MKLEIVIAYYNNNFFLELLDFFNDKCKISIYNKSNNNILKTCELRNLKKYNITNLENIGREGDTYLNHIIMNYENLNEYTLFIQDDTNNHILDNHKFFEKTNIILKSNIPFYQYDTTWNNGGRIIKRHIRDGRYHLSTFSNDYAIRDACKVLNIRLPKIYVTPTCAFFIIHKSIILKYSKTFYINLKNWLLQKEENGYILEHIWKLIFDNENTGITEKKTSKLSLRDIIEHKSALIITKTIRKYISTHKDKY